MGVQLVQAASVGALMEVAQRWATEARTRAEGLLRREQARLRMTEGAERPVVCWTARRPEGGGRMASGDLLASVASCGPMPLADRPLPPCPRCGEPGPKPDANPREAFPEATEAGWRNGWVAYNPLFVGMTYVLCRKCEKIYAR